MIQGQEKICNRINGLTLDSFPRSLMLVGPSGSGKHLIAEYISKRFNLLIRDITTTLDQDSIEELYNRVEPYLYIINANEISVKDENAILKFIEEPLKNSYIVLLAETDIGILHTILNRCQIWYLQNYTKECLSMFVKDNNFSVLDIATTPGQVIELCNAPIMEMTQLATKIIDKINVASVANTLTISDKLRFKNEPDKYDIKLFVSILLNKLTICCKRSADRKYTTAYIITSELMKKLHIKNLDYKALFECYLINLRTILRGEQQ